ncbi:MAG: hypothetical protein J6O88_03735 [Chryseobacterium sp.]|uniref:hypothetical protein n=1 Tax=Chryseobacterium sp. TaxID=1871047 RepID=UPI001B07F7F0|nr:hypothetical protein [Chryseobacterium sp.]MBO6183791.1 hypothetical protein [Chryseobacterium sp.]
MSANWAYNLDMLAQNGVIDFDGASFVTGQKPRYVGRPLMPPSPYVGQVPPAQVIKQPEIDEFQKQKNKLPKMEEKDDSMIHNPSWKKWLFGALALGGLIFAGLKAKSIYKWAKGFIKNPSSKFKWSDITDYTSKKFKAFKTYCGQKWDAITNWFKTKSPKP